MAPHAHPAKLGSVGKLGIWLTAVTPGWVARAGNPAGTTAMWVRDQLDGLWEDEDLAWWYPRSWRAVS